MVEMNAGEVAENLAELIQRNRDDFPDEGLATVTGLRRGDVPATNAGFVVTLRDGSEFQVTVVRSRRSRD